MYKNREELPGGLQIGDYILIADLKKVSRANTNNKMVVYSGHWLRVTGLDGNLCHGVWEQQSNPGKCKPETFGWSCKEWYWHPEHIAGYFKGPKHMEQFKPTARKGLPDI